jgi:hypothetical protein
VLPVQSRITLPAGEMGMGAAGLVVSGGGVSVGVTDGGTQVDVTVGVMSVGDGVGVSVGVATVLSGVNVDVVVLVGLVCD